MKPTPLFAPLFTHTLFVAALTPHLMAFPFPVTVPTVLARPESAHPSTVVVVSPRRRGNKQHNNRKRKHLNHRSVLLLSSKF